MMICAGCNVNKSEWQVRHHRKVGNLWGYYCDSCDANISAREGLARVELSDYIQWLETALLDQLNRPCFSPGTPKDRVDPADYDAAVDRANALVERNEAIRVELTRRMGRGVK